jgi:hypothetical protein
MEMPMAIIVTTKLWPGLLLTWQHYPFQTLSRENQSNAAKPKVIQRKGNVIEGREKLSEGWLKFPFDPI